MQRRLAYKVSAAILYFNFNFEFVRFYLKLEQFEIFDFWGKKVYCKHSVL
jgi:hypothetical protein